MKKIKLFLFAAVLLSGIGLHAGNTLTYTATEKLTYSALDVGKTTFGPAITSHTFSSGTGIITCSGEITTIGDYAFWYRSSLTSVTIPNSVTTIGDSAFYNCRGLTGALTIPNSVTTIGERAFYNCSGLTGALTIPNSVTTIGIGAFCYCSGLTSVTIPNSVTTIGYSAFGYCRGLTSVTIPNSVTTIGEDAFTLVNNIVYNGTATGSPWGAKCVNGYVDGYLVYSDATKTKLCGYFTNATGAISIPNSVTTIGEWAFYYCSGLTSVTIPNSVTTIGKYAFAGCSSLTSITIPNSVTTIGVNAFRECSGLTSVTIGNSVTTIGIGAFCYCSGLTSVTIPNSVTTIGDYAFGECSSLTSITIPNSVTTIGDDAFEHCTGLTGALTIPNSVTTIGDGAFSRVNNIVYSGTATGSPWGAKCINGYVDGYLVYSDATKTKLCGCSSAATGAITIPNSVTTIGDWAFYNCRGLTGALTIPNSVTTIGDVVFRYCSGLTSITIPNSVTTIGDWAFDGCRGLTSVTIPNSVTTIGNYAFEGCSGLTSITCYATTPPTCGSNCFYNVRKSIPVYVPAQSVDAYKQADEWKEFMNILIKKRGQCGEDLYWQYNDGILVISGTGAMYDYTQGTAPWTLFQDSISSLVINNGCTSIGNFAFYGLSNKNLKTIDIPSSVEQIGQYAFANCEYVKNLYLGLSLERISANAFANDERLLYITCYAIEPPLLDESAFVNYDAYLSVPCESQADYKVAIGWKKFNKENVSCIGAEETPVTTDEVTVAPEANQATFTWPQNDQAAGYSIVITKDGVVFCTLKFNAQGQLTGNAFAPGRDGQAREMAAMMTANGWQFTVTGLDQASKYGYTLDALNASQQSIKHYQGEFYTDGYTGLDQLTDSPTPRFTKIIRDNRLLIFHNGKIYNAVGGAVR